MIRKIRFGPVTRVLIKHLIIYILYGFYSINLIYIVILDFIL